MTIMTCPCIFDAGTWFPCDVHRRTEHLAGCGCDVCWHTRLEAARVVCAWCDTVLLAGCEPVSHGICATCEGEVFHA